MTDKPYEDAKTLAKLRKPWSDSEGMTYSEIADKLGVSTGTISIRFNNPSLVEEIESYGPDDFQFDTHVDELDSLDPSEVAAEVARVGSEYGDAHQDGSTVEVGEIYLFVSIVSDSLSEAIDNAYESRMANACVAISEDQMSNEIREKLEEEAIGFISVSYDGIEVVQECRITHGSGIRPLFDGRDEHATSYQSKAWLKNELENGATIYGLADRCSLLTRTVENLIDEYKLN